MPAASASPDVQRSIVVMGVSGCGKSTIGQRLAESLGLAYLEGDAFHPAANVERMRAGQALTDADRQGWLQALGDALGAARAEGRAVVLACSALKRRYRDVLRAGDPDLRLVFLRGDRDTLAARIGARRNHYMPASLLDSQIAALEAPDDDENALAFDVAPEAEVLLDAILRRLRESAHV